MVYARSPSPLQRPGPTTIASRSLFPQDLCSFSTSFSKMKNQAAPNTRRALGEIGIYSRSAYCDMFNFRSEQVDVFLVSRAIRIDSFDQVSKLQQVDHSKSVAFRSISFYPYLRTHVGLQPEI